MGELQDSCWQNDKAFYRSNNPSYLKIFSYPTECPLLSMTPSVTPKGIVIIKVNKIYKYQRCLFATDLILYIIQELMAQKAIIPHDFWLRQPQ